MPLYKSDGGWESRNNNDMILRLKSERNVYSVYVSPRNIDLRR